VFAQKPAVNESDFGTWPSVENPMISNNGKFSIYTVDIPSKTANLVVLKSLFEGWEKEFVGTYSPKCAFSADSRFLIVLNRGDSLIIFDLITKSSRYVFDVKSFELFSDGAEQWIAYQLNGPSHPLILWNLKTEVQHKFEDVQDFQVDSPMHSLLLQIRNNNCKEDTCTLLWVNLKAFQSRKFWTGKRASNFIFNSLGDQLVFLNEEIFNNDVRNVYRYYRMGDTTSSVLYDNKSKIGVDSLIVYSVSQFTNGDNDLIISLAKMSNSVARKGVDVWSYKDAKLQSLQITDLIQPRLYKGTMNISNRRIIRIEHEGEYMDEFTPSIYKGGDSFVLVTKENNDVREWNWNKAAYKSCYIVSLLDGSRKMVKKNVALSGISYYVMSYDRRYVIYYDPKLKNYFSYNISTGRIINLTSTIGGNWCIWSQNDYPKYSSDPYGVAGWIKDNSKMIIYDQYDIFIIDPSGAHLPLNITNSYGRMHNIVFRIAAEEPTPILNSTDNIILSAFNLSNKDDGFFSANVGIVANPKLLTLQSCIFTGLEGSDVVNIVYPIKAADTNIFVVRRMTSNTHPNYYWTSDFKSFTPISNLHPELTCNWITSQLFSWKQLDGSLAQGILYKPIDFDSSKKYPLIIYYYEKLSDGLNAFLDPEYCEGPLNIPYFVSNGYLIFTPDISYKVGNPGPSVCNAVISSAQHLSKFRFVNKKKIGIQGHSRGGYETNYLIAHTNIFAAAASACGMSDYINLSLGVNRFGKSRSTAFEIGPQRLGTTFGERPDVFVRNSPIFEVNKVTTPVLILANKLDTDVPYNQGLEFFMALRRLGKKAWMLQYDGEGHLLHSADAKKDYTIRLKQFFDFYLKNSPPPRWLTEGIPVQLKGIEKRLELDYSGTLP